LQNTQKSELVVKSMKNIVPEFISKNSVFATLDKNPHLLEN